MLLIVPCPLVVVAIAASCCAGYRAPGPLADLEAVAIACFAASCWHCRCHPFCAVPQLPCSCCRCNAAGRPTKVCISIQVYVVCIHARVIANHLEAAAAAKAPEEGRPGCLLLGPPSMLLPLEVRHACCCSSSCWGVAMRGVSCPAGNNPQAI